VRKEGRKRPKNQDVTNQEKMNKLNEDFTFLSKKVTRREAISTAGKAAIGIGALVVIGGAAYAAYVATQGPTTTTPPKTTTTSSGGTSSFTGTINLGGSLPLTGPLSRSGQWTQRGWNLAAQHINERGGILGKKVNITALDDGFSEAKVPGLYDQLGTQVDQFLGPYGTGLCLAASSYSAKYNKLMPFGLNAGKALYNQGLKYVYSIGEATRDWYISGPELGMFMELIHNFDSWKPSGSTVAKPTQVGLISTNNAYGQSLVADAVPVLKTRFADLNITFTELIDPTATDYTPTMTKARDAGVTAMCETGYPYDALLTSKEALQLGFKPPIYYCYGAFDPQWLDPSNGVGPQGEGMIGYQSWLHKWHGGDSDWLRTNYKAQFSIDANYEVALGYSQVESIYRAATAANSLDVDKLRAALSDNVLEVALGPLQVYPATSSGQFGGDLKTTLQGLQQWQSGLLVDIWASGTSNASSYIEAKPQFPAAY
jgi:ABC-type branched-subunit amino acid transport system substrate-binding protein